MYYLVDGNNFFVSCEVVFRPDLKNKAVVVAPGLHGCVVARSKEAKAMDIYVGQPLFMCKALLQTGKLIALSSNHTFYKDMSHRMMQTLMEFGRPVEIYSIDEAFIHVPDTEDHEKLATAIVNKVRQWTGIEVSIGIAPTRTLAKLATHQAKESEMSFAIAESYHAYKELDVREIWGVGRRTEQKLKELCVCTIGSLMEKTDTWIKRHFTSPLYHTVLELKGVECAELEEVSSSHSLQKTRTFKDPLHTKAALEEEVASFVSILAEKLRREELIAHQVSVFIATNRHSKKDAYVHKMDTCTLSFGVNDTPSLIKIAMQLLNQIFAVGPSYKRAGVCLQALVPESCKKTDLFEKEDTKMQDAMKVLDRVNERWGHNALYIARSGNTSQPVGTYTSSWDHLLTISL